MEGRCAGVRVCVHGHREGRPKMSLPSTLGDGEGKGEGGELLKAAQSGLGGPLFLKIEKKSLFVTAGLPLKANENTSVLEAFQHGYFLL